MNYVEVVNLVFVIINGLFTIYCFHFIFFAVASLFKKKKFPHAEEKCRYAVIVSAKDEENVIPRLIGSIRDADYPKDKIDIYIIAHNCSDRTGDVSKSLGANVITYNNPDANTLGSAYNYAFKQIDFNKYDGVIVLNADNVVKIDYFEKFNDAFVSLNKNEVIVSFRHSLNIKDGVMPAVYAYYFAASCSLCYVGREAFGIASRITGCGFLLPSRLAKQGWKYTSITEDIEFSADYVSHDNIIHYCDDAIFYDEQPLKFKTMWFQRLRWAKGQNNISRKYFWKFFKALFSRKNKHKTSLYIGLTFNSCITLVVLSLSIMQLICLFLSPLFGVSLQETFLYWNHNVNIMQNLFFSLKTGALFSITKSFIGVLLSLYLIAAGTLIASRGKFKGYPRHLMILAFLVYPFFVLLQFPLDVTTQFVRNVKWKKIPHGVNSK